MESPVKKNQTPLIIAGVAIVLCCCVIILAVAGYIAYTRMQSSWVIPLEPTEEPVLINPTDAPASTEEAPTLINPTDASASPGEAPTGGLGNDILRNDTWQAVAGVAQGMGCDQPIGADTKIEVLQQPDNGVWVEKWTVACVSGNSYPFEITFTLDATGATYDIKSLP